MGGDTDGTTNPLDVGFGGIVAKKQADFIGKSVLYFVPKTSARIGGSSWVSRH